MTGSILPPIVIRNSKTQDALRMSNRLLLFIKRIPMSGWTRSVLDWDLEHCKKKKKSIIMY